MQPFRSCLLAVPVIAGLAIPFASPAEAHRRHGGAAALITGLIGLGVGALAGGALSGRSDRDGQGYDEPAYAPRPSYGYAVPTYVARPHPVYAPPPVYYAPPPVAYYALPPAYQGGPAYARWGDDD
jgi:hypothetical protein